MKFEDVYRTYYKDVFYFLLSMSGNPDTAEELTQETFYRALKNIHKFKGESHLKTWLCQIGKNAYLSWLKKQKHLADQPFDTEIQNEHGEERDEKSRTPEEQYLQKEQTLSIYKILHFLEEPYKEVFTLKMLGDLSYREIAEIFGQSEGWARVTFHRAKLKVKSMIREV